MRINFQFYHSNDENESVNDDTKAVDEDKDSGKGDTLAKTDDEDKQKK